MRPLSFLAASAALGFAVTTLVSVVSAMAQAGVWTP